MRGRTLQALAIAVSIAVLSGCALAPDPQRSGECEREPTTATSTIRFDGPSSIEEREQAFAQAGWRDVSQEAESVFATLTVNNSWVATASSGASSTLTEVKVSAGGSRSSAESERTMSWFVEPLARAFEDVLDRPPTLISYGGGYCTGSQPI